jgi:hypothetical protein
MQNFTCKTEVTDGHLKLAFSGYLTLQNAREIKTVLAGKNDDFHSVDIHAYEVSGIDVSFLQLIEAFRLAQTIAGRKARITFDLPYDLKTLLANAGVAVK